MSWELHPQDCPLCGKEAPKKILQPVTIRTHQNGKKMYLKDRNADLVVCKGCGLVFEDPLRPDDYFKRFHQEDYFGKVELHGGYKTLELDKLKKRFDALQKYCKQADAVLEVASASGVTLFELSKHFNAKKAVGLEPALNYVEAAQKQFPELRIIPKRLEEWEPDGSYDLILAGYCVGHFTDPLGALQKLHQALSAKGVLFIDDRATPFNQERDGRNRHPFYLFPAEKRFYYSPGTLKALLQKTGFEVIETGEYEPHPHHRTTFPAFYLVARKAAQKKSSTGNGALRSEYRKVCASYRRAVIKASLRYALDQLMFPFLKVRDGICRMAKGVMGLFPPFVMKALGWPLGEWQLRQKIVRVKELAPVLLKPAESKDLLRELYPYVRKLWEDSLKGLPTQAVDRFIAAAARKAPRNPNKVIYVTGNISPDAIKDVIALQQTFKKRDCLVLSQKRGRHDALCEKFADRVVFSENVLEMGSWIAEECPGVVIQRFGLIESILLRMIWQGPMVQRFHELHHHVDPKVPKAKLPGSIGQSAEKFLFEHVEGSCHIYAEEILNLLPKTIHFHGPRKTLRPYCVPELGPREKREKLSKRDGEVHVAYAAGLARRRKGKLVKQLHAVGDMLEKFRTLTHQKIHVHLYLAGTERDWKEYYQEYKELSRASRYFHIEKTLPYDKLLNALTQYDWGFAHYDMTLLPLLRPEYRTRTGNNIYTYLQAGLPLIIHPSASFNAALIREFEIGCSVETEDLRRLGEILKQYDVTQLQANTVYHATEGRLRYPVREWGGFVKQIADRGVGRD